MGVDSAAKELRRLGKTINEDDIVVVILNGVASEYDTEVRLLKRRDDVNPPRNKILQSLTNQYYRLQKQKSSTGGKALLASARGTVTSTCQLYRRPRHGADQYFGYDIECDKCQTKGVARLGGNQERSQREGRRPEPREKDEVKVLLCLRRY